MKQYFENNCEEGTMTVIRVGSSLKITDNALINWDLLGKEDNPFCYANKQDNFYHAF